MSGDGPTDRDEGSATAARLPPEFNVRRLIRRAAQIGLVVLVALVAISMLPRLSEVRERLTNARPAWLLVALGLKLGSVLAYMALDVAALGAAFHVFGAAPSTGVLVLAYTVGQLGGLLPIPGGIGGVDGGLIAALVIYGTSAADATAAVLAYRTVQLGVPAIVGTVGFVRLQPTLARSSDPAALCAPMAAGALR